MSDIYIFIVIHIKFIDMFCMYITLITVITSWNNYVIIEIT